MPIYEFECKNCRHTFEVRRLVSEMESVTICPSCGSSITQRKFPTSFTYLRGITPPVMNTHNNHYKINGVRLDNIMINGSDTGIKAKDARIRGKNIKMRHTRIGIDAEDSDISIKGLHID